MSFPAVVLSKLRSTKTIMNTIQIYFDGGCAPTNPGYKYGSFEVLMNGSQVNIQSRFPLGFGTNNEAEFESLIKALDWTLEQLTLDGYKPGDYEVKLFTDSKIVVNRINGENRIHKKPAWRESSERMFRLANLVRDRLVKFADADIEWNPRERNVERFGH